MVADFAQGPAAIVLDIRCHPELSPVHHDARQLVERFRGDKTTFMVALLVPGVGEQQECARNRRIAQALQHVARVVGVNTYIGKAALFHLTQQFRHTVYKRFAPDQANHRVRDGLRRQMLPATKPDFQPDFLCGIVKECFRIVEGAVFRNLNLRQKDFHQIVMMGPQGMALAPAIKKPPTGKFH